MELFGQSMTRADLMRRVGGLSQVGGVQMMSFEDGHGRGTRILEFRTGSGFRFGVLVDRGLDVGPAEFNGAPLQWEPAKGFAAPAFYEEIYQYSWLRYGLGGLCNTAGLLAIGDRQNLPLEFNFAARAEDFYGIHGHVAVTPSRRVNFGEAWGVDGCTLWAEGVVIEEIAYGEHLSITRRYETALGSSSYTLTDRVRNEGHYSTPHMLMYHFNIGYPVVSGGARLVHALGGDVSTISYAETDRASFADSYRECVDPQPNWGHLGGYVPMARSEDGSIRVALVNGGYRPIDGGLGVFLRYDGNMLPTYTHNHMMAEGLYSVGMEPQTNPTGPVPELLAAGYPVMIEPGEERTYQLEFGVLAGAAAIDGFVEEVEQVGQAQPSGPA